MAGLLQGTGVVYNFGVITAGYLGSISGVITLAGIINDGQIVVGQQTALSIESALDATAGRAGVLDINAQGRLTLDGAVASSQSVTFLSGGATLALGNIAGFAGTLDGLASGMTIDFLGLDVISATANGTSLDIGVAGRATFDLTLDAPLSGVALQLLSDGSGGTDLIVQSAASLLPAGALGTEDGSASPNLWMHLP